MLHVVITNLRQLRLKIQNLNWLILIIKNWPSDAHVGYDGPLKSKAIARFLERDSTMIEEYNRLIEEQDFFEEDSNSNCIWF